MKCPKWGLINPESAQRCDCGYDFEEKRVLAPYLRDTTSKMTIADKLRFMGGFLLCFINGVTYAHFSWEGMGATTGNLMMSFLVAYAWKGRKRPYNWRGISQVFFYASLALLLLPKGHYREHP